ncbi:hypothetical protein [Campylobacter fetus]|uniref:Zinc ribbon domain-containing protein n=1 Tax=Campylobacter fetus subsp. testudinum TaxID=1507806 RepID=A0AAX0H9N0_CAMFE|nr:hypothetical protein [Campylobacter fetus]OCR90249.1 hypothetical protein CFT12S02225_07730 [Campylobacter fetus subsp. testudinum]OCR93839.1 hypothetical protein CFT12S02842_07795 [Campylobacter fetus subsp. testudinum]OCS02665.1 hypothetical protein CFTCF782_07700 [Campylobacter fetus subsp. testudinum]
MRNYKICKKCECRTPANYSKCPACGYKLSLLKVEYKISQDTKDAKSDELKDDGGALAINGDIDDMEI